MRSAHDVRRQRAERISVSFPHQWLSREVKDDFWPGSIESRAQCASICEIGTGV
jgi:hypothetical protein